MRLWNGIVLLFSLYIHHTSYDRDSDISDSLAFSSTWESCVDCLTTYETGNLRLHCVPAVDNTVVQVKVEIPVYTYVAFVHQTAHG